MMIISRTPRADGMHRMTLPSARTAVACTTAGEPSRSSGLNVVGFLGEQRIAADTSFEGTTVGGFSGLDRDRRSGEWVIISDDRSTLQPARFYTADLRF